MATIYVDGSSLKVSRRESRLGWGVVVVDEGTVTEHCGSVIVKQQFTAYHEVIAIIEAIKIAVALKIEPSSGSFITDDEVFGYAPFALHPENHAVRKRDAIEEKVHLATKKVCCRPALERVVLEYLRDSRIEKVKGHSGIIYNERADYLAKFGSRATGGPPAPFEHWFVHGIIRYASDGRAYVWKPPFADLVKRPVDLSTLIL